MAQPQQNITISAPGFWGLNTQDSPIGQSANYAAAADNCVIDKFGRVAARKGFSAITTDKTELGSSGICAIHEFVDQSSNSTILSVGNSKVLSGTTTLVDETPAGASVTADDWDIATFNDDCYFFQRGHKPIMYQSGGTAILVENHPSYLGSVPRGNVVCAAYGRLWVADITGNKHTVYWSDLLTGMAWAGGTSGSIDVEKFWPNGSDEIVDLVAHNGFLIIFGKRSILVFSGADNDPGTNLALEDAIGGIGAAWRGTALPVNDDIWFLDVTGVRSLGRTIQEKSIPVGDISRNVRDEIQAAIREESSKISCVYHPENAFYLVAFDSAGLIYCFDARRPLEDGSARPTRWINPGWTAMCNLRGGSLYLGSTAGLGDYSGYDDNGASYRVKYMTHEQTFGAPAQVKIPKQIDATFIGGAGSTARVVWGFDYKSATRSKAFTIDTGGTAQYNVDEYEVGEYTASVRVDREKINATGSGASISFGFEAYPTAEISLQEMNIQALVGRII